VVVREVVMVVVVEVEVGRRARVGWIGCCLEGV
jgi:hypothetical protein